MIMPVDTVVYSNASYEEVIQYLYSLPEICSGRGSDSHHVGDHGLSEAAREMMDNVHHDYLRKSLGQKGEDGIRWPSLARATVKKRLRGTGKTNIRQSLYQTQKKKYKSYGMIDREAARRASQDVELAERTGVLPWPYNQNVPILVESGDLLSSTEPGTASGGYYTPPMNQLVEKEPGKIAISSEIRYADRHMTGDPEQPLPKRAFMPEEIPDRWDQKIGDAYAYGAARAIAQAVKKL
jgi:hypothetical protein